MRRVHEEDIRVAARTDRESGPGAHGGGPQAVRRAVLEVSREHVEEPGVLKARRRGEEDLPSVLSEVMRGLNAARFISRGIIDVEVDPVEWQF